MHHNPLQKVSLWSALANVKSHPALKRDLEADIAIVGGGITGISTAYLLAKAGKKVIVLEAYEIGRGTTGSSTGNLYAPVGSHLYNIESKHDADTLGSVVGSRSSAIEFIEQRIQEHQMECDFQRVPFYLFTTPETASESSRIAKEIEAALSAGLPVDRTVPQNFPFQVDALLHLPGQAQFNPLQYVQQLAAAIPQDKCRICEHTKVTDVEDGEPCLIQTNQGTVSAKQVIMATHTPKGIYAVHTAMKPEREYVLAVTLNGPLPAPGTYWHLMPDQLYSLRPVKDQEREFLMVLGEPHIPGEKKHNEENVKKVEEYLRRHFDVNSLEYVWAAQNYQAADQLPYIGNSPLQKNVFIATGFAADGLVYGTLAAMIISDLILGNENSLADLYSPIRFTPKASAGGVLKESLNVAKHLLKDYLFYSEAKELKDIQPKEGKTIRIDNERLAAYRDETGKLHLVSGICPHMGCVVHWNSAETSWDCPCHGSRFSIEGEVLEGPAYEALAQPKKWYKEKDKP